MCQSVSKCVKMCQLEYILLFPFPSNSLHSMYNVDNKLCSHLCKCYKDYNILINVKKSLVIIFIKCIIKLTLIKVIANS